MKKLETKSKRLKHPKPYHNQSQSGWLHDQKYNLLDQIYPELLNSYKQRHVFSLFHLKVDFSNECARNDTSIKRVQKLLSCKSFHLSPSHTSKDMENLYDRRYSKSMMDPIWNELSQFVISSFSKLWESHRNICRRTWRYQVGRCQYKNHLQHILGPECTK